ncbi:hypothetical protein BH24DEI2_BH24DEI2_19430 [soil metagenome]
MTPSPSLPTRPDWLTLIAISALAMIVETALHEHLGHALALVLLGGVPTELGAFYVDYDNAGMNALSLRLVALAGPVMSLLTGLVSFSFLRRISNSKPALYYFVWLLGTIGFMTATGYLLFSGVLGIGDFGTERGAVFYQASPEWLWRTVMAVVGGASYYLGVRFAIKKIEPRLGGSSADHVNLARRMFLFSYLTGAAVAIAIGFLNPLGIVIVLTSAAAATLGGTSGFTWMAELFGAQEQTAGPGLAFQRRWVWIVVGGVVTLVYAVLLGPTIYL